jgi:hypothetical protein
LSGRGRADGEKHNRERSGFHLERHLLLWPLSLRRRLYGGNSRRLSACHS